MKTLAYVVLLSAMLMQLARAQPAGFGECYSSPNCQGIMLGHWDYAFCARAGSSWRSDADGTCY
jgi:hypothetical protein